MASVITIAGEQLFAAKAQANEQLDIDTFIFANVPNQDPNAPINREEGIPTAHIVYQQNVQQVGRINDNVVVYSTVLDSITGPFEFNWVGLYSSVNQKLVAINHVPTVTKTATAPGAAGNTLNRNFGIEYSGIAELTGISVEPETWQLDFTARLSGMDKLTQQLATDMNGKDWFIDDGLKVVPRATANTFSVTPGVGYVSGLRVELKQEHILIVQSYPQFVYVDAWFSGNANSTWSPQLAFTVTNTEMDDYIDPSGTQHYVYKLAVINAADDVEDLRTYGYQENIKELIETSPLIINDKFLKKFKNHKEAFQHAINSASVRVVKGTSVDIDGDITITGNRKIIVENGASVTSNGRFTAYGVNNVHWEIHGDVLSREMTQASAKSGWPNYAEETQLGNERGFIEFGGIIFAGNDGDNYSVYVSETGRVMGDWVGTPNFSDQERQVNRKGIAAWNCSNVSFVCDGEIAGFEGEAIYWFSRSSEGKNIYMRALNLHDCRFNGLNVNALLANNNIKIEKSTTRNCYHGIESSAGDIVGCTDYESESHSIYAGQGHGGHERLITGNKSINCKGVPFSIAYNRLFEDLGVIKNVEITNNHAINPKAGFIAVKDVDGLTVSGNTCQGLVAGRFLQVTGCKNGIVSDNSNITPAAGTTHIYRGENLSVAFSNNYRNYPGNDYTDLDQKSGDFIGGRTPTTRTNGNRENFQDMYCPPIAIGVGGEYRNSYGEGITFVGSTTSTQLEDYDAQGARASYLINTLKINTDDELGTSLRITASGNVLPGTVGTQSIGSASLPWDQIFAETGSIQPSDSRLKTRHVQISDLLLDAWGDVNFVQFKYLSAIERKGSLARIHFGVIAQQIFSAFESKGINALDYGLLCYDSWEYQPSILDDNGNILKEEVAAGDRWSIRPDECLFLEAAYMRRELSKIKAKIN